MAFNLIKPILDGLRGTQQPIVVPARPPASIAATDRTHESAFDGALQERDLGYDEVDRMAQDAYRRPLRKRQLSETSRDANQPPVSAQRPSVPAGPGLPSLDLLQSTEQGQAPRLGAPPAEAVVRNDASVPIRREATPNYTFRATGRRGSTGLLRRIQALPEYAVLHPGQLELEQETSELAHESDPDTAELVANREQAARLLADFLNSGWLHGCSAAQHASDEITHYANVGDSDHHHTLRSTWARFPPPRTPYDTDKTSKLFTSETGLMDVGLMYEGLPKQNDSQPRQSFPDKGSCEETFEGVVAGSEPKHICLHHEQEQRPTRTNPEVSYDGDSLIVVADTPQAFKVGIRMQTNPYYNTLDADVHFKIKVKTGKPGEHKFYHPRDLPGMFFGDLGHTSFQVRLLFPRLKTSAAGEAKDVKKHLTDEEYNLFMNGAVIPALKSTYTSNQTQYIPPTAEVGKLKAYAKTWETQSGGGNAVPFKHFLAAHGMREFWDGVQQRLSSEPRLAKFQDAVFYCDVKNTKQEFLRGELLDAMEAYDTFFTSNFHREFIQTAYFDIASMITPAAATNARTGFRDKSYPRGSVPSTYLWKTCCLEAHLAMIRAEWFEDQSGQATHYASGFLYEAQSMTLLPPATAWIREAGLVYMQFYNSSKAIGDAGSYYLWQQEDLTHLGIDTYELQNDSRARGYEAMSKNYIRYKKRASASYQASATSDFGSRVEARVHVLVFSEMLKHLQHQRRTWGPPSGNTRGFVTPTTGIAPAVARDADSEGDDGDAEDGENSRESEDDNIDGEYGDDSRDEDADGGMRSGEDSGDEDADGGMRSSEDSGNDEAPVRYRTARPVDDTDLSCFWSIRTEEYCQFMFMQYHRYTTVIDMTLRVSDRYGIRLAATRLIAIMFRLLAASSSLMLGGGRESVLWYGPEGSAPEGEAVPRRGLGLGHTMQKYGFGWLMRGINWEELRLPDADEAPHRWVALDYMLRTFYRRDSLSAYRSRIVENCGYVCRVIASESDKAKADQYKRMAMYTLLRLWRLQILTHWGEYRRQGGVYDDERDVGRILERNFMSMEGLHTTFAVDFVIMNGNTQKFKHPRPIFEYYWNPGQTIKNPQPVRENKTKKAKGYPKLPDVEPEDTELPVWRRESWANSPYRVWYNRVCQALHARGEDEGAKWVEDFYILFWRTNFVVPYPPQDLKAFHAKQSHSKDKDHGKEKPIAITAVREGPPNNFFLTTEPREGWPSSASDRGLNVSESDRFGIESLTATALLP